MTLEWELQSLAHVRGSILFVVPYIGSGGIERILELKAPWLARRGHRVEVLAFDAAPQVSGAPNRTLRTLASHGIPVRLLPARGRFAGMQRTTQVAAHAIRGGFHAVVGHELLAGIVVVAAKLLATGRFRALTEVHIALDHPDARVDARTRFLSRRFYRRADGVLAVSQGVRADAARFLGLDPSRITMIYNPVPVVRVRELAAADPPPALTEIGPYIVGCGRLTPMKGFEDLIAAFARVRALRPGRPLRLVILGEGPDEAKLRAAAAARGLGGDVLFPGFAANPFPWFAHAGAFVLSSRFGEAFSLVLAEAMACGVPTVSTRCQWGPEELLAGGDYGLLCEVADVEAMARGIVRVLDDPATRARYVAAGARRVEAFSEGRILPALERYYVMRRSAPAPRVEAVAAS